MKNPSPINKPFFWSAITAITVGFIVMKLDNSPMGLGPVAMTLSPILVLSGYVLAAISIFYKNVTFVKRKEQMLFIFAGWGAFLISLIVYIITLEETASLWDCAEFIACAYKLQVPHAPGAPLFLMVGRLFSLLAFGDTMKVAYWINMSSAVSSAFVVMFVFWSVVMLGRRINSNATTFSLVISGFTGAFCIAFADSFWFSAVEAETYAMATLFLVLSFWSILKWSKGSDSKNRDCWMIFIFYALGLSVGVHPMSLLVLPALALVIIFKNRPFSWKKLALGTIAGSLAILFLNHIVLFGLPDIIKIFEVFFVNSLGLPIYLGAVAVLALLVFFGYLAYRWSERTIYSTKVWQKPVRFILVGIMYFLIGYSSYFMIIIRSQADTPINSSKPDNIISLASYLKRESYGSRPLLFGPGFDAKVRNYKKGSPVYALVEDRYIIIDHKMEYEYDKNDQTILPRMYSNDPAHIETYRSYAGLKKDEKPRFIHQLKFMFTYQFGHMYLRYLMFNFSGRESDVQHASWLGPLDFLEDFPDAVETNKAHNNYLMLPLLLGLLGLVFQYKRDKAGFWALMVFFLFMGLILVFYLNSPPGEPRERDYIYVGSYLAFAMWCGLGAMAVLKFLSNKMIVKNGPIKYLVGFAILGIPVLMLVVGFDDHNRSGRTLQVDHARNTLNSCAPNAILFTGGDNDTFPLWYLQEVEGFRTDVRVIVLSYFNGDWYIDQMKRKVYDSDPLPISLAYENYQQGGLLDVLPFVENPKVKGAISLERYLDLVREKSKAIQVSMTSQVDYNAIPSRTFYLNIHKDKLQKELVPGQFAHLVPAKMEMKWHGNYMGKSAFMVLDLIATNNWERPIYFNMTSLNAISLDLERHLLQEGLVYRLLPIELPQAGTIDLDRMYENLMIKAEYRDLEDYEVYYNHEDFQLRILQNLKMNYNQLAEELMLHGEKGKAQKVMTFVFEHLHGFNKQNDLATIQTINLLYKLDEDIKAMGLAEALYNQANQQLLYFQKHGMLSSIDAQRQKYILTQLHHLYNINGEETLANKCATAFEDFF